MGGTLENRWPERSIAMDHSNVAHESSEH